MKVLVLSHMYPSTFNEVAGIFVHEQVKALTEKGVEVQVVSPVPWTPFPVNRLTGKWKAYSAIPGKATWEGIPVWYPRYLTFPRAWSFASSGRRMYGGIKDLAARIYQEFPFDLVHAHAALPDGYVGALLKQSFRKPLLTTIHGQDAYVTMKRNRSCWRNVNQALIHADRVIVVSEPLRKALEEGLKRELPNIQVIHNGVSLNKVFQGQIKKKAGAKVILTLGYLIERKGHKQALEAVARLLARHPHLEYKIAGRGPLRNSLEELSKELSLESVVEFLGFVPNDDLPRLLASCDVFLLPSWDEAFGVVYLEAMANGKPVIGCQGEGIEDFVEHGKTGLLVKPRDVDSLVEALDFLLSHPEEARGMGERARMTVLANYTWEKNAEKTVAVYREVLSAC